MSGKTPTRANSLINDENHSILDQSCTLEESFNVTLSILKKSPKERTPDEINILCKGTEDNTYFKNIIDKYGSKVHYSICQDMFYAHLDKDEILFEAGSYGTTFYIILSGTVALFNKVEKKGTKNSDEYSYMQEAILDQGKSLGELAIMGDVLKPRSCTVKALEECYFGVLERTSYKNILGVEAKKEMESKTEFMSNLSIFKHWSNHALKSLLYYFVPKKYNNKQVVYKEGDNVNDIFLIRSGEVKCLKSLGINVYNQYNEVIIIDEKSQVYAYNKEPTNKNIELGIITSGQLIGEEEAYYLYTKERNKDKQRDKDKEDIDFKNNEDANNPTDIINNHIESLGLVPIVRETTIVCSSQEAEIWSIPFKIFFWKLDQHYFGSMSIVKSIIACKINWRESRIQEFLKSTSTHINLLVPKSYASTKTALNGDMVTTIKEKHFNKYLDQEKYVVPLDNMDNPIIPPQLQKNLQDFMSKNKKTSMIETNDKVQPVIIIPKKTNQSKAQNITHNNSIQSPQKREDLLRISIDTPKNVLKSESTPQEVPENNESNIFFFNTSLKSLQLTKNSKRPQTAEQIDISTIGSPIKHRQSLFPKERKSKHEIEFTFAEPGLGPPLSPYYKHFSSKYPEYRPENLLTKKVGGSLKVKQLGVIFRPQSPKSIKVTQTPSRRATVDFTSISQSRPSSQQNKNERNNILMRGRTSSFKNDTSPEFIKITDFSQSQQNVLPVRKSLEFERVNPENNATKRNSTADKSKTINDKTNTKNLTQKQYITLRGCDFIEKNTLSPTKNKLFQYTLVNLLGRRRYSQRMLRLEESEKKKITNGFLYS